MDNNNYNYKRRERFHKSNNFVVFYGHGRAEALSKYDVAIVEPAGQSEQTLAELRAAGTLIIAYVSFTEIPEYDAFKPLLRPSDYLTLNGTVVQNNEYNTAVVDLRSKNWINLLMHRIGGYLRVVGYDGIFIDTISNVEWPMLPAGVRAEQQGAAVALMQRLRSLYPDYVLLQNNGLETLCEDTVPYIDGICWENPDFVRPETYKWHENVRSRLKRLTVEHNFRIMILLEEGSVTDPGNESAVYWAQREKYMYYKSPNRYLDV